MPSASRTSTTRASGLAISQLAAWASHAFPVASSTHTHQVSLLVQVGVVSKRLMRATLRDVIAGTKPKFGTLGA